MSRFFKFFLICLMLNNIFSLQDRLNEGIKKPIELKMNSATKYDKYSNYFFFNFTGLNNTKLMLLFFDFEGDIYLTNPLDEINKFEREESNCYIFSLTINGTYYLELNSKTTFSEMGGTFMAFFRMFQKILI